MFSLSKSVLLVLGLSRVVHSMLATSYSHARFEPADQHFLLVSIAAVNSSGACFCRCMNYVGCIIAFHHGVAQICALHSAELWQGRLQLTTRDTMSVVISRTNMTIPATKVFSNVSASNATVYPIWNTTAGGNSSVSTPGLSMGNFVADGPPQTLFDGNVNSSYMSLGACSSPPTAPSCGLNTGFYVTFSNGPYLLRAFRMCTGQNSSLRDPVNITIEGSNADSSLLTLGSSWTSVYNGTSGLATDPGRQMFGLMQRVNSSIWYSSYRLLVVAKRGLANGSEYSEVEFLT